MKTAIVVGNPKPNSRTLEAAVLLMQKLTGRAPDRTVDVVTLDTALLRWGDAQVAETVQAIQNSRLVIFASPTYKASYTGLLKLFLDQFPSDGLAGVIALPLMLGAGPAHAMAPELHLKPVLVELGALCPARGLYLLDKTYLEDPAMEAWVTRVKPVLALLEGGIAS